MRPWGLFMVYSSWFLVVLFIRSPSLPNKEVMHCWSRDFMWRLFWSSINCNFILQFKILSCFGDNSVLPQFRKSNWYFVSRIYQHINFFAFLNLPINRLARLFYLIRPLKISPSPIFCFSLAVIDGIRGIDLWLMSCYNCGSCMSSSHQSDWVQPTHLFKMVRV